MSAHLWKNKSQLLSTQIRKRSLWTSLMRRCMQRGTCDCMWLVFLSICHMSCKWVLAREVTLWLRQNEKSPVWVLAEGRADHIPHHERTLKKFVRAVDTVSVFHTCRMPEDCSMVQCCNCDEWYHIRCVNVPNAALEWTVQSHGTVTSVNLNKHAQFVNFYNFCPANSVSSCS